MSRLDEDSSIVSTEAKEIADIEGSEVESSVAFSLVDDALKLNEVNACQQ